MDKAWITRPTVVPVTERERSFRLAIGCGDRFRWAARPTTTSPLSNAETRTSPGAAERPRRRSQQNALTGRMSPAGPAGAGDLRIGRCSPRGLEPPSMAARSEDKGRCSVAGGCGSRRMAARDPAVGPGTDGRPGQGAFSTGRPRVRSPRMTKRRWAGGGKRGAAPRRPEHSVPAGPLRSPGRPQPPSRLAQSSLLRQDSKNPWSIG